MKLSLVCMVAVTVLCLVRSGGEEDLDPRDTEEYERLRFQEDSPLVLYLATVEMLICGSCAATAAAMYSRQGHQLRHPAEHEQSALFTKVELCKDPGFEDCQLYGLGFRPSSDGLECLVVEDIRRDSLLDRWNHRSHDLSPEELVEQALGEEVAAVAGEGFSAPSPRPGAGRPLPKVALGSAIVAVNDVYADVGLMQQQLFKPQVTLWVRREDDGLHPSELDAGVFGAEVPPVATGPVSTLGAVEEGRERHQVVDSQLQLLSPLLLLLAGAPAGGLRPAAPRVARAPFHIPTPSSLFFLSDFFLFLRRLASPWRRLGEGGWRGWAEDEEAQILTRWTVCGIMFGWVTLLPVLLMQPHEERCGAELFRQFLLKPCLFLLPLWMLLWILDCLQLLLMIQILHPFYYFAFCHTVIPGVLVWYLFAMQATEERIVLDQRRSRRAEEKDASCDVAIMAPLSVVEDAAPVLLKELITLNPVAMLGLGTCASIPILLCSLFTVFQTRRARHAQGFVNLIYGLLTVFQLASLYLLYHLRFAQLPEMYLAAFYFLISIPCFAVWCVCLACANHFAKKDLQLCESQRIERAKEALKASPAKASGGLRRPPCLAISLEQHLDCVTCPPSRCL
ncbi:unnamed protein product [Symbiodinium necroappetens]|uniref:Uncharacterized protein n=1 Tax=Symbiodinium necroappetens TaxID=1628268 RepID=A0A812LJF7_9DINO|nr:unnamed protein product [Symbiodinium necroappetens]